MGLTNEALVKLTNAGFVELFQAQQPVWAGFVRHAYQLVKTVHDPPCRDDVAAHLALLLRADETFVDHQGAQRARAKYYSTYFADYIVDQAWEEFQEEEI